MGRAGCSFVLKKLRVSSCQHRKLIMESLGKCWETPRFSVKKRDRIWKPHTCFSFIYTLACSTFLETLFTPLCAKSEVTQHVVVTDVCKCLLSFFLQSNKWPYLIVTSWHIWGLRFAQHSAHLLCLSKPVISKIIPDGTKEAELII